MRKIASRSGENSLVGSYIPVLIQDKAYHKLVAASTTKAGVIRVMKALSRRACCRGLEQ